MNYIVRIYALYSSIDGRYFYVGATKNIPSLRLTHHITSALSESRLYDHICVRRSNHIKRIISKGGKVKAKILRYVTDDDCNFYEEYYYRKLLDYGYNLIQSDSKFYSQSPYIKSLCGRLF